MSNFSNSIMTLLGSNAILGVFLAALVQYLWGLINALQIIMLTGLFHTDMPTNAEQTIFAVIKLTNLDLLQTDKFWETVFTLDNSLYPPLNARFEEAGFESSNFLVELGPAFFVFLLLHLAIAVKVLLRFCFLGKSQQCCRLCTNKKGENLCSKFLKSETNYKSLIMRFFLESCI